MPISETAIVRTSLGKLWVVGRDSSRHGGWHWLHADVFPCPSGLAGKFLVGHCCQCHKRAQCTRTRSRRETRKMVCRSVYTRSSDTNIFLAVHHTVPTLFLSLKAPVDWLRCRYGARAWNGGLASACLGCAAAKAQTRGSRDQQHSQLSTPVSSREVGIRVTSGTRGRRNADRAQAPGKVSNGTKIAALDPLQVCKCASAQVHTWMPEYSNSLAVGVANIVALQRWQWRWQWQWHALAVVSKTSCAAVETRRERERG